MSRECVDWISSFIEYTENSEPPRSFREWTAISTIASVLERKCYLEWGESTYYPNMYVILVGPSGSRKGTAMGVGHRMLRELGKTKLAAEAITREALIRELKESDQQDIDLETGDVSYNASLTIYSEELAVFLGHHDIKLIRDLTDWYDCRDHWTYRTKNMGTDDIVGVWVNMLGATTPDLIRIMLPPEAIGGGFTSRVMFIYESNKGKTVGDPFLTEEDLGLRDRMLHDLDRIYSLRGRFRATEDMVESYINWYEHQSENPPFLHEHFMGYISRRQVHLLKLCMIVCVSQGDRMIITRSMFDRALGILLETERKMLNTFSGMGRSSKSEVMNKVMRTIALEGTISKKELMKRFLSDLEDLREFSGIIESLTSIGFCRHDMQNGTVVYNDDFQDISEV